MGRAMHPDQLSVLQADREFIARMMREAVEVRSKRKMNWVRMHTKRRKIFLVKVCIDQRSDKHLTLIGTQAESFTR